MADGRVVTWGNADSGGDSSAVQDQLVSVTAIKASHRLLGHVVGGRRTHPVAHPDVHRAYGLKSYKAYKVYLLGGSSLVFSMYPRHRSGYGLVSVRG